jgi:hypothetical protein
LDDQDSEANPPSAPKRKRRGKGPLVENEVRSSRIREINNVFKSHSSCSDKNCLTCSSVPPTFRPKVVKNLAASFCKVEEDNLEAKLSKKGKKMSKENITLAADGNSHKSKSSNKN